TLGYNAIRIPFSSEALQPGQKIQGVNVDVNPDLDGLTTLEMLDRVVDGARARGLKVILDRHQLVPFQRSALWYGPSFSEDQWIAQWQMLAMRYYGNDTVIGFDLHNEPSGAATWGSGDLSTDWRLAAQRAGNAILKVNPYLLIFVEGIEYYNGDRVWWGANL